MSTAPTLPCPLEKIDDFIARPPDDLAASLAGTRGPFLVLGAGGKLGLHVAMMLDRALQAARRKERVLAVSRFTTLRSLDDFAAHRIPAVTCDLEDPRQLESLPDAGTVVFLAGVKFGTKIAPLLLHRLNVAMPQRVAQRFRTARLVAFSSGAVYPFVPPATGGATEYIPPAPVGDYAASCVAREHAFADASRQYGTAVALVRLNYSVEFRYGVLVDIAQKVLRNEPINLAMGYVNVLWQTDAIAHSLKALSVAASPATTLNVTGPDTLSVRELALRFGGIFGRAPRFVGQEADTALLSNASQAHRLFGRPRITIDTMVDWTAAWLGNNGATWDRSTGFERSDGEY